MSAAAFAGDACDLLRDDAARVLVSRSSGWVSYREDDGGKGVFTLRSAKKTQNQWDLQTSAELRGSVRKGETVEVSFNIRGKSAGGAARMVLKVQDASQEGLLREDIRCTEEWNRVTRVFCAGRDYAGGELSVVFFFGLSRQVIEVCGLTVRCAGGLIPGGGAEGPSGGGAGAVAGPPEIDRPLPELPPEPEKMTLPALSQEERGVRRYAVLELDGVTAAGKNGGLHPKIALVADDLEKGGIQASFGVIVRSLEDGGPAYADWFKRTAYQNGGLFEFTLRGWDDAADIEFNGRRYASEFAVPDEAFQRRRLEEAQRFFHERTGLSLQAFSVPFSGTHDATRALLREYIAIRSWIYGNPGSTAGKFVFPRTVALESRAGCVAYDEFLMRYTPHRRDRLMVLQGFPALWDDSSRAHFRLVVEQLKRDGWIFTTPTQYLDATGADRQLRRDAEAHSRRYVPFSMGGNAPNTGAADLSGLNAGGVKRLHLDADGRIVDADGRRVRLFGTNLTFGNCFPSEEESARLAVRLASMGMNIVRIHHHDKHYAPAGIWKKGEKLNEFDPGQMRRLDRLLAELSRNGIYVDLNLHVSREHWKGLVLDDGLADDKARDGVLPKYGKALDKIDRRFIDLQKKFAVDYLGHVNEFTGMRYADDPAIAIVEINNENTLHDLRPEELPASYAGPIRKRWNEWLRKKYGDTAALRAAWGGDEPLGAEVAVSGPSAEGPEYLSIESEAPDEASARLLQKPPQTWMAQLQWRDLDLADGQLYTLSFQYRADAPHTAPLSVRRQIAGWENLGLSEQISFKEDWQTAVYSFTARAPVPGKSRIDIVMGGCPPGAFQIRGFSLRPGGRKGLLDGESLEDGTVGFSGVRIGMTERGRDWKRFLAEAENAYVSEMTECVRSTGYDGFLFDSQASYGGLFGLFREARSGFIDMHSYWQHPSFPGRGWDMADWNIGNSAMSASPEGGANLGSLAHTRVAGLPFGVSEYDHAAPNEYVSEMFPMIGSYAARQDWDVIIQFDWGSAGEGCGYVDTFFSLSWNPAKLSMVPVAALLFRAGAMPPAGASGVLTIPAAEPDELSLDKGSIWRIWGDAGKADDPGLNRRIAVRLDPQSPASAPARYTETNSGEESPALIRWEQGAPYSALSERAMVWTGMLKGKLKSERGMPGFVFRPDASVDGSPVFGTIALAAIPGDGEYEPIGKARRHLLAACGRVANTDMGWNSARTSVGVRWGGAPTLCETVPGSVRLAVPGSGKWRVWALDGKGNRVKLIKSMRKGCELLFRIGPEDKTIWYEIESPAAANGEPGK